MRKNIFVALVALCLAVPGMATVSSCSVVDPIAIGSDSYRIDSFGMQESPKMDPQLVQDILKAAAGQCEYDYATLQGWYDDGTVSIQKMETGYNVLFSGGGGLIVSIEDNF
jgi:hypothetical protein